MNTLTITRGSRSLALTLYLAQLSVSPMALGQAEGYGPSKPIEDAKENGISYRQNIVRYANGPKAITVYWRLLSHYQQTVEATITFTLEDGGTEICRATLVPGEEKKSGGWWTHSPIVSAVAIVQLKSGGSSTGDQLNFPQKKPGGGQGGSKPPDLQKYDTFFGIGNQPGLSAKFVREAGAAGSSRVTFLNVTGVARQVVFYVLPGSETVRYTLVVPPNDHANHLVPGITNHVELVEDGAVKPGAR